MSERLNIFLKTITDFADAECEKLEQRAQSFKEENISAYKKEAEEKSRSNTQYEKERILSRVNREISDYEAQKKSALASIRENITEKVFNEVKEKIEEFTSSPEYESFLIKSADNLKKAIGDGETVFFVRTADLKYENAIKSAVKGCTVLPDDEIVFGGLRAVDKTSSVCADDTLDSRLSAERANFVRKADLKIY